MENFRLLSKHSYIAKADKSLKRKLYIVVNEKERKNEWMGKGKVLSQWNITLLLKNIHDKMVSLPIGS